MKIKIIITKFRKNYIKKKRKRIMKTVKKKKLYILSLINMK